MSTGSDNRVISCQIITECPVQLVAVLSGKDVTEGEIPGNRLCSEVSLLTPADRVVPVIERALLALG